MIHCLPRPLTLSPPLYSPPPTVAVLHHTCAAQGLLKFFRELYEGGDENTQRAMLKSMQESGALRCAALCCAVLHYAVCP